MMSERKTAKDNPVGVLVMAYGGPNALEEIPGYLAGIRDGRTTPPEVIEKITNNYRRIGGFSPLLEVSRRQVQAVAARLDPTRFRCYLGMKHWAPWIEDVVRTMVDDAITHAVSVVLAPQYSHMSIARYQERIREGLAMTRGQIEFLHIENYYRAEGLIEALARRVGQGIDSFPESARDSVHVVFTAHSLPERILAAGDPYDKQCRGTARLVAERAQLSPSNWSWSYQSAGRSPEPWLGPDLKARLSSLAASGCRNVVVVPVGFVSDHVEILYDIDVEAQGHAQTLGLRLERPPGLNDDPLYIQTLARLVRERATQAEWLIESDGARR